MAGYNKLRAPELTTPGAFPSGLSPVARRRRIASALRYKDQGIYHDVTWRDYRRLVSEFLAGLEALRTAARQTGSRPWRTHAGNS